MHPFIPGSLTSQQEMLNECGLDSLSELFRDIPDSIKLKKPLNLNGPYMEHEAVSKVKSLASKNYDPEKLISFRGGGSYDHIIPEAIHYLTSRSEFLTAYTPYQPEISQGTLQYIFEFQSLISELTGLPTSNASLYDGATAACEAMFLSVSQSRKKKFYVSSLIHPRWKNVLKTYARFNKIDLREIPSDNGLTDIDFMKSTNMEEAAGFMIQSPNYFGFIEDLKSIRNYVKNPKTFLTACTLPHSLALLEPPGECGFHIAVGEAQPLGLPQGFGGPGLGFISVDSKLTRKIPGRVCGMTEDASGFRAFSLTLQTREQHIRREKATSNICSNQSHCALSAAIYLSLMGHIGFKKISQDMVNKAHVLYEKLIKTDGISPMFENTENVFFHEFPVKLSVSPLDMEKELLKQGFLGGVPLEEAGAMLFCATEKRTLPEIDAFVKSFSNACKTLNEKKHI